MSLHASFVQSIPNVPMEPTRASCQTPLQWLHGPFVDRNLLQVAPIFYYSLNFYRRANVLGCAND